MSARDDLALARRHPAATGVTLLLALVFGAAVGGVWDGGWSALAALLVVALFAGWIALVAYGPPTCRERRRVVALSPPTGDARERYEAMRRAAQVNWPSDGPYSAPALRERLYVTGYDRDEETS